VAISKAAAKPMNIIAQIRKAFRDAEDEPGEMLASLLLAAKDDPALRDGILALITAPVGQRESMINTALHEMRLRGESAAACAAFATLATEEGAKAAWRVLQEK
jgi:hypothetical protein